METLTFHSLRGGQTTGARARSSRVAVEPDEKIEYTLEVDDRRRVPPLRRLCPCFSLWCCLPCVLLLLVPPLLGASLETVSLSSALVASAADGTGTTSALNRNDALAPSGTAGGASDGRLALLVLELPRRRPASAPSSTG